MEQQKLTKFFLQIMGKVMTPHFYMGTKIMQQIIYILLMQPMKYTMMGTIDI